MFLSKRKSLVPTRERTLTANQYIQDLKVNKDNMANVEFIPPKLGSKSFGRFRVKYKTPLLVAE